MCFSVDLLFFAKSIARGFKGGRRKWAKPFLFLGGRVVEGMDGTTFFCWFLATKKFFHCKLKGILLLMFFSCSDSKTKSSKTLCYIRNFPKIIMLDDGERDRK